MKRVLFSATLALAAVPFGAIAQEAPAHATPQDALEALMGALETLDPENLVALLGPEIEDLVRDIDNAERAEDWELILDSYREGYRFVPIENGRVGIELGEDDWPFPMDVVRGDDGWRFDVAGGHEEIRDRLVGLNELDVIDAMEAYVEVQSEYRQVDHDDDGVLEFAAYIISSEGKRDGLYWPGGDSPIGDAAARASLDGYAEEGADSEAEPFLGYYFRLLDRQGKNAPGGAFDYMVNGNMLAGHALLAVPATYGETGIHSFLVAENGTVFEADLGEDSLEVAFEITAFDPDDRWSPVDLEE